jgi:hypothetical protein
MKEGRNQRRNWQPQQFKRKMMRTLRIEPEEQGANKAVHADDYKVQLCRYGGEFMKRIALALMALLVTACGLGTTSPTSTPAAIPGTEPIPVDLTPAQLAVLTEFAIARSASLDEISLVSTTAVNWPDSCLGVIRPNLGCAGAITPGFRVLIAAKSMNYEYHTNESGSVVVPATLAMIWHRSGGIAGFCDDLYVYLSGEAYGSDCKTGDVYPAGTLTVDELVQLDAWVKTLGATAIDISDLAVADAISTTLTFNGSGPGQPGEDDKSSMLNWTQTIYDRVKPCC